MPKEIKAYECEYCEEPYVFLNKEEVEEHESKCIMNPDNKTWATDKRLGVELYPPLPKYKRKNREGALLYFLGPYARAFNTDTGEYIPDMDFYGTLKDHKLVDTYSNGRLKEPHIEKSKEYLDHVKKLRELDKEGEKQWQRNQNLKSKA